MNLLNKEDLNIKWISATTVVKETKPTITTTITRRIIIITIIHNHFPKIRAMDNMNMVMKQIIIHTTLVKLMVQIPMLRPTSHKEVMMNMYHIQKVVVQHRKMSHKVMISILVVCLKAGQKVLVMTS